MIECRGRNGWFKYAKHYVKDVSSPSLRERGHEVHVGVYSASPPRNAAPIMLCGPVDELLELFEGIVKELKEVKDA